MNLFKRFSGLKVRVNKLFSAGKEEVREIDLERVILLLLISFLDHWNIGHPRKCNV